MEEKTKQPRKRAPWRDEIDVLIEEYREKTGDLVRYNSEYNSIEKVETVTAGITNREGMYWWLKFKLAE